MQIFGKNIKIENMYKLEPKVGLMDLVNILIENIVSEYYSNPDIRNIKETLNDGEIKIYPSGIIVRLHLNQNINGEYSDKYQIHCSYFYDYSKDSFCSSISGKVFFPNVGLLNV